MLETNVALPSKPRVVSEEEHRGVFEIDGLYPGYGHTLGNSLRRIILSSLPGASITQVKIEGVGHEFSTIDSVKEDVITILLNLERIRIKMHGVEPLKMTLKAKGTGIVTAADIDVMKAKLVFLRDAMQSAIGRVGGLTKKGGQPLEEARKQMELAIARYNQMVAAIDKTEQSLRALNVVTEDSKDLFGTLQQEVGDNAAKFSEVKSSIAGMEGALGTANTAAMILHGAWVALKTAAGWLVNAFNFVKGAVLGVLDVMKNVAQTILGTVVGAFKTVAGAIGNIAQIIIGINLASALQTIVRGIKDIGMAAFNAAADFQLLFVRMQGLVARDLAEQFNNANQTFEEFSIVIHRTTEGLAADSAIKSTMSSRTVSVITNVELLMVCPIVFRLLSNSPPIALSRRLRYQQRRRCGIRSLNFLNVKVNPQVTAHARTTHDVPPFLRRVAHQ